MRRHGGFRPGDVAAVCSGVRAAHVWRAIDGPGDDEVVGLVDEGRVLLVIVCHSAFSLVVGGLDGVPVLGWIANTYLRSLAAAGDR